MRRQGRSRLFSRYHSRSGLEICSDIECGIRNAEKASGGRHWDGLEHGRQLVVKFARSILTVDGPLLSNHGCSLLWDHRQKESADVNQDPNSMLRNFDGKYMS